MKGEQHLELQFLVLLGVFIHTSYTDIKKKVIKNYITFPLMGFGLLYHMIDGRGWLFSIKGMGGMLFLTVVLSLILPNVGMGDLKLMMGIGSLMGYDYALHVYFYALLLFIVFYGLKERNIINQIKHGVLTIKQAIETKAPVNKTLEKGKALAPFIAISGIVLYFTEYLYLF